MSNGSVELSVCTLLQNQTVEDIRVTNRNIMALLPLIYAIPSILLTIRLVLFLVKSRKQENFSGSFYKLFIIASFVDLFYWISFYCIGTLIRAPIASFIYSFLPPIGMTNNLIHFFGHYVKQADFLMPLILSLNRFTAVVLPVKHDRIWKKILPLILVLFFSAPLFFTWKFLFVPVYACRLHNFNNIDEVYYSLFSLETGKPSVFWISIAMSELILSLISAFVCFCLNCVTIGHIIYYRKFANNTDLSKNVERKLFFVSFMMFVNETLLGFIQLGLYYTTNITINFDIFNQLATAQSFVVDVMCLSPPWLLLFTSKTIRKRVCGIKEEAQVQSTPLQNTKDRFKDVPWRCMIFSPITWAIIINRFAFSWAMNIMLMLLPSYFRDVLSLNMNDNGLFTALPFLAQLISKNICAINADRLRKTGTIGMTNSTRIIEFIESVGCSLCFASLIFFVDCTTPYLALTFLILFGVFAGGLVAGAYTASLCIAPDFSGTIESAAGFMALLAMVILPTTAGFIIQTGSKNEWNLIFGLASGITLFAGVIFTIFGSAEIQPWSKFATANMHLPRIHPVLDFNPIKLAEDSEKSSNTDLESI